MTRDTDEADRNSRFTYQGCNEVNMENKIEVKGIGWLCLWLFLILLQLVSMEDTYQAAHPVFTTDKIDRCHSAMMVNGRWENPTPEQILNCTSHLDSDWTASTTVKL